MRRSIVSRFAGLAATLGVAAASLLPGAAALAQSPAASAATPGGEAPMIGQPHNWAMSLQQAAGPVKESIHDFNQLVLWIIVIITIFVGLLMIYAMWRFRAEANPVPSRTSHHTVLEIAWTVVPVLILIGIAVPSFRLIYYQDRARDAELTVNVTGRQWYWHYAYPDQGNFAFDSYPIQEADLKPELGHLRNLSVDEPMMIPVGKDIRIITTGQDVIHSFFVPSLGVQKYTIPGRTMETWLRADRVGTFYGQCNQICGTNHWFMPIVVKAVPQAEFDAWVASAKQRFAQGSGAPAQGSGA
ncbi:cytochrome c oxidase subunit II, partial [Pseudoroseomonas deserti]